MKVKDAAERMGVSQQFIRVGLQRGLFPWGYAVKIGGRRYTYYINERKFNHEEFGIEDDNCINGHSVDDRSVSCRQ